MNFLVEHTLISIRAEWLLYSQERSFFVVSVSPKGFCTLFRLFCVSFKFHTELLYVLVEYYLFVYLTQGCTNLGRQVTSKTKFRSVAANIFKPWIWNLLRTTELSSGILRWLLHLRRFCAPLIYTKLSVAHTLQRQGVGWLMDTELESTWEEAFLS
jgi:hypothetical protein